MISFSGEARLINPELFEDNLVFNSFLLEEEGNYSCDSHLSISSPQLQTQALSIAYYIVAAEGKILLANNTKLTYNRIRCVHSK